MLNTRVFLNRFLPSLLSFPEYEPSVSSLVTFGSRVFCAIHKVVSTVLSF
jgi:hypothetical protein